MPSSSHVPNIIITVLLQALATSGAGFGTVTLLVDESQGTGNSLGADVPPGPTTNPRFLDFVDYTAAQAAQASGFITVEVLAACLVAFSQSPVPAKFRVCRVDTANIWALGVETYTSALTLLEAEAGVQGDLWGFCMDSRTLATQLAFALTMEAKPYALMLQDADATWLTAADPPAWAAATEYAKSGHVFHDTDSEWGDVSAMVAPLAWDPDIYSVPWERQQRGVAAYATFVTSTQRVNALANDTALLGTWGSTDFHLDNVVTFDGRPFYERLTADWLAARVSERLQTMHQRETDAGRKVLVNEMGMGQTLAVIRGVVAMAEAAGHFTPGQSVLKPQAITDADRTARRLRVNIEAQVGIATRTFTINANLSTTPVIE